MHRPIALAAVLLATLPSAAHAQRMHAGLLFGRTSIDRPASAWNQGDETVIVPTVVAGVTLPGGLLLEARASRLHASTTDPIAYDIPGMVTVATDALMAEATVGIASTHWQFGPVQSRATLGALVARVTDRYRSDTPEERVRTTLPGVSAALGADVAVGGPVLFRVQGSWRHLRDGGRPALRYGLDGASFEVGLLLRR